LITGVNGMAGYWSDVSYGHISLEGSAVYGWYTLPFTQAEGRKLSRMQRVLACINVAADDVDLSQYFSVIAIVNAQVDSGAVGSFIFLDPLAWFPTLAAHEMGHVYGLSDSRDDSGITYCCNDPGVYGDGWDIMSAMTFGNSNPVFEGALGTSGPGLNAPNLDKLGWLGGNRVSTWNAGHQNVQLAALNHPEAGVFLMAKVPLNPDHYYTIEFRRKTGWDAGIPRDTVLIHEVRPNGLIYLVRTNGGPERLPDQTFRDVVNNVAITVLNIDSAASTATVNIGKNEVWVDFDHTLTEIGTFDFPYATMVRGLNSVAYNGTLKLMAGSSRETPTINRRVTLEAYGGPVTIGQIN
jgi:hypothetical protein